MKTALLLVAFTALLSACRSTPTSASAAIAGDAVPFRTLARGYQSGVATAAIEVAHNADEWRALWTRHTAVTLPRPPLPDVDWSKEMVVSVALGERPTAGFALEITQVALDKGVLHVVAVEKKPAKDAIVPMVITQPYHMIATARRDGDVRLDLR
jgi:hypothetical protein